MIDMLINRLKDFNINQNEKFLVVYNKKVYNGIVINRKFFLTNIITNEEVNFSHYGYEEPTNEMITLNEALIINVNADFYFTIDLQLHKNTSKIKYKIVKIIKNENPLLDEVNIINGNYFPSYKMAKLYFSDFVKQRIALYGNKELV